MLDGPVERQRRHSVCQSCGSDIAENDEPVFCTFCGNQNDAQCLKKTRLYPRGSKNSEGKLTERGKICKVCDYKFLMRDKVKHTYLLIETSKQDIVGKLRILQEDGTEAKAELRKDGQELESTSRQIRELEKIPIIRTKGFDPTEAGNFGLLEEMSIAELRERLEYNKREEEQGEQSSVPQRRSSALTRAPGVV